jgi:hypothetical protein
VKVSWRTPVAAAQYPIDQLIRAAAGYPGFTAAPGSAYVSRRRRQEEVLLMVTLSGRYIVRQDPRPGLWTSQILGLK